MLVKNEADIIRYSLQDACRWSDKIIVIDNGSTGGTWEAVQQMALDDNRIVPFLRYCGPFHIGLRAKAFRAFRKEMTRNDWWCVRLDADELFSGDVRAFLASVPRCYRTIKKESTDYILTKEDVEQLTFTGDFSADRHLITHFLPHKRRERRFVRHSPLLVWSERWRYPHLLGRVSPTPIPVEHYQYRSPEQMKKRFSTRQQAKQDGCGSFKHERGQQWEDYLMTNCQLQEKYVLEHLEEQFDKSDKVLYNKRNTVKIVGDDLVVKRFRRPRFPMSLLYGTLYKSKARRSYEYARRLGEMTPEPVMYKQQRCGWLLRDSYYVSRLSRLPYTMRMLEHDLQFPDRQRHLDSIARFTAKLHNQGIIHRDYSGGNILFDDNDNIQLVDLNRVRFRRHISLRAGLRNLGRLLLTADERQRFEDIYLSERKNK